MEERAVGSRTVELILCWGAVDVLGDKSEIVIDGEDVVDTDAGTAE